MIEIRNIVNSLIYNTQISFSKIKALIQIHCYNEGVDRMCRELEVNGAIVPVFHTDDFILKVTVSKVTEKVVGVTEKVTENSIRVTERVTENPVGVTEKIDEKLRKVTEKAAKTGETLTENRLKLLRFIIEDPYISKSDLAQAIGLSYTSISRNIEAMRGKYLRRVGPDKGGFWEIIE